MRAHNYWRPLGSYWAFVGLCVLLSSTPLHALFCAEGFVPPGVDLQDLPAEHVRIERFGVYFIPGTAGAVETLASPDAEARCNELGGHLAVFPVELEQRDPILALGWGSGVLPGSAMLVGCSHNAEKQKWVCPDGSSPTESQWWFNQPDGSGDCAALWHNSLDDVPCERELPFVCYRPTCVDTDECAAGTHTCWEAGQECTNTEGSFACLDPCELGTHDCFEDQMCIMTDGSFNCHYDDCKAGFHDCNDDHVCLFNDGSFYCDYTECLDDPYICTKTESYYYRGPGYETCRNLVSPFRGGYECVDFDECAAGTHNCGDKQCFNTEGSFACGNNACETGTHDCDEHDTCIITDGSYNCILDDCKAGFHDCNDDHVCFVNDGSFYCDYTECLDDPYICTKTESYLYRGPGYETCRNIVTPERNGYECVDFDECAAGTHTCTPYQQCFNTDGSFVCDENECELGIDSCTDYYQSCINTLGGYDCTEKDECLDGTHDCYESETCVNTDGSYQCDFDECAYGAHTCGTEATCVNTVDSFQCACAQGYFFSDSGSCDDVNECAISEPGAVICFRAGASCNNTEGSFTCTCPRGSTMGEDGVCELHNECLEGVHDCPSDSVCMDTVEGFECRCPEGSSYIWGVHPRCEDVDECTAPGVVCGPRALCSNSNGSFVCSCADEFVESAPWADWQINGAPDSVAAHRPVGVNIFFQTFQTMQTYGEAQEECGKLGGQLVQIHGHDELVAAQSFLPRQHPSRAVWVGAADNVAVNGTGDCPALSLSLGLAADACQTRRAALCELRKCVCTTMLLPDGTCAPWGSIFYRRQEACVEDRTWRQLSQTFGDRGPDPGMVVGGLGTAMVEGVFESWACVRNHACLSHAAAVSCPDLQSLAGGRLDCVGSAIEPQVHGEEWMCFTYDESSGAFVPWGTESQLRLLARSGSSATRRRQDSSHAWPRTEREEAGGGEPTLAMRVARAELEVGEERGGGSLKERVGRLERALYGRLDAAGSIEERLRAIERALEE